MKCQYVNSNGKKCNLFARANHSYCWHHSPDVSEEEKLAALKRGGKGKQHHLVFNLPDLNIENVHDLPPFLIDTVKNVRGHVLDAKIGSVIGYLINILLRSYEVSDLQSRIEKIEQLISSTFVEIKDLKSEPFKQVEHPASNIII